MFCPKCGASNQDNATFCSSCGNTLTVAPGGSVPPSSPLERKSPIIAAILNFFLFGVGYLYLGYKKVLGIPTILFVVIVLIVYIIIGVFTFGLLELVVGIFLAYDGYVKAKGRRGYLGTDPEYLYGKPLL
jgi:zinc-ribbon domain